MKLLYFFTIAIVISWSSANAETIPVSWKTHKVNTAIGMNTGTSGQIFYNCDSAERQVESFLEDLGATNINIRCTGGLEPWGGITTIARVHGSFDTMMYDPNGQELAEMTSIRLRGWDNCALIAELFWVWDDKFTIENLRGMGSRPTPSCRTDRNYNVQLDIAL